ncbi:MAG TPA: pilus assembly protein TadG-related protein [Terriglobales bacterium]|nr:pilus assembly protein TadG-related protein [Terriglobales bacterium]
MRAPLQKRSGQALLMVTVSLFAMCGVIGLATDLGWAYFVRKSAQAAADSGARAACQSVFNTVKQTTPVVCSGNAQCQPSITACGSVTGNLQVGCEYASSNGFDASRSANQNVTMAAGTTSPAPTAPGVNVDYWVTTRAVQAIPQLFSSVLGNRQALVAARATAAIVHVVAAGNLYALNRENDPGLNGTGIDIHLQGSGAGLRGVNAGGVFLASDVPGTGATQGSATVRSMYTQVRLGGTANWSYTNGTDGAQFKDPMRDLGQPPAPQGLPNVAVPGGSITGDCSNPLNLTPGNYYATDSNGNATGGQINITGCVNMTNSGAWGSYVFFGGVLINSPHTVVTVSPGMYIFAGTQNSSLYAQDSNATITDQTALVNGNTVPNTDAGEIFVFAGKNYPNLQVPPAVQPILSTLNYGSVDIQTGNHNVVNLHGLNADSANLPTDLAPFAPTVFWQDQGNSLIKYTADGNIDLSCGGINTPCLNPSSSVSPSMNLQAHPNLHLYGAVYQPRGAALTFQGSGTVSSPVQLITGTLTTYGGPTLTLLPVTNPFRRRAVALIE